MRTFDEMFEVIRSACGNGSPTVDENTTPKGVKVPPGDILAVMRALLFDESMFFDSLSCVTGIDNGPGDGTMEVAYNLYSIPYNHHLMIKVTLSRDNPVIESVSHLWRTADWFEREIFDMFGIIFLNHPDLRRILMPADWDGHPLRKDYKQQEYYRDIKVAY
ncbi:MAG TPA: NADH-quinone oxidoreductase subunit C [Chryseolinea sp.]|nr:NADH-quinone oxidoreductase subunit C [Chryseolinea sp.]